MNLQPFLPQESVYEFDRTNPENLVQLAEMLLEDSHCKTAFKRVGRYEDFNAEEENNISNFIHTYVQEHNLTRIFHSNALVAVALARLLVTGCYEIGAEEALKFAQSKCSPKCNSGEGWTSRDWCTPTTLGDVLIVARDLERRPWVVDIFERGGGITEPKSEYDRKRWLEYIEELRVQLGNKMNETIVSDPITDGEWMRVEVLLWNHVIPKYGLRGFDIKWAVINYLRAVYCSWLYKETVTLPTEPDIINYLNKRSFSDEKIIGGSYA